MAVLLSVVLLATGLVVKQDAQLRRGCETGAEIVAHALSGSPVQIRFAINGSTGVCYKVAVQVGGKTISGFLPASSLTGLEEFTTQVQQAPTLAARSLSPSPHSLQPAEADNPLVKASKLLDQHQPRAALGVMEQAIRVHGRGQQYLLLAGIAASQADEVRVALDYLRDSQQMLQDLSVQRMIEKLEREQAGDKSSQRLYGDRFLLRYEYGKVDAEIARGMVAMLEQEFSRISAQLGCRTDERITTVVQSWPNYRATTGAAEWSGGQFDGRIHIPLADSKTIDERTRQVFAHELVHACLANLGAWPAWLHEGLAQKLSGETLSPSMRSNLLALMLTKRVPRLENMSQSWSRLSSQHAAAAYTLAFAAAEILWEEYANFGIANVLRNPSMLPQITLYLDKRLFEN